MPFWSLDGSGAVKLPVGIGIEVCVCGMLGEKKINILKCNEILKYLSHLHG